MAEMKYIILEMNGMHVPIIFPNELVHSIVANAMKMYVVEEARLLNREWVAPKPISAGTIHFDVELVSGHSETLKLKPGKYDAIFIETYNYGSKRLPDE